MNATKQACWLGLLLVALASAGWYIVTSSTLSPADNAALAKFPDMMVTELALQRFDVEGTLIHSMHTPTLYHVPETDTHFFESPTAWAKQNTQPPVNLKADHGKMPKGGEELIFYGNVQGEQHDASSKKTRTFKTEEVIYFPKKKHVFSQNKVFLEEPNYLLSSKGMRIDLEEKHLQCLSEFRLTSANGFKSLTQNAAPKTNIKTNPNTNIAAATESGIPAEVSADSASFNQKTHQDEYIGHFNFSQNTTHLQADKAITQTNTDNQWVLAIASGSDQAQAHYWAQPTPEKPVLHAYADKIYYYPQKHWIELIGNARVIQGNQRLEGEKIRFDTLNHHLFAKGNPNERTLIIINPKELPPLKEMQRG